MNTATIAMGVESARFSPQLRSVGLRAAALESLGLPPEATLLVGVGRFSGEKRWEMVIRAVQASARDHCLGLLLIGDGPRRPRLEVMASSGGHVRILPRLDDRQEVARLLASADSLVHGCEAETFCLVAAEARASGLPMIVPDRGAALDLLAAHAGTTYRAGNEAALTRAIARFIDDGVELQRAAAVRHSAVRTIDDHFAELFEHYARLGAMPCPAATPIPVEAFAGAVPALALARSGVNRS